MPKSSELDIAYASPRARLDANFKPLSIISLTIIPDRVRSETSRRALTELFETQQAEMQRGSQRSVRSRLIRAFFYTQCGTNNSCAHRACNIVFRILARVLL